MAVRRTGPARGAGRALLMRLHFYIGIFIGPLLLIAAVSGAAYALSPQLERVVYTEALTGTVTEQPLSLDQQVAAAQVAAGVDSAPAALRPVEDGGTTRVMFAQPHLGPSEHRGVFVDPGTGEVVGDMTVYGTSGSLPFRTAIDQLHRSLLLGGAGRLYSELAASWLWVAALSGLGLWVLRWRRSRRGRLVRGLVVPDVFAPAGHRRTLSWHSATGVWAAAGFLFLSADRSDLVHLRRGQCHRAARRSRMADARRADRPERGHRRRWIARRVRTARRGTGRGGR